MGYYTKFELSVIAKGREARDQRDSLYEYVENTRDYFGDAYLKDILDGSYTMKWYEWRQDMEELSKKYPLLIFLLEGVGQEDEVDVWRAFIKNGKILEQQAELKFDEPDLSRLD